MPRALLLLSVMAICGCAEPAAAVQPSEPEPPPPPPASLPSPANPAPEPPPPAASDAEQNDTARLLQHAIYTPDPDQAALQNTKAARFDKADGKAVIGFCVDTTGVTVDVHVVSPFPGDPQIDAILVETIEGWRFKPFLVDGRPTKTCTQRTWNIKFK